MKGFLEKEERLSEKERRNLEILDTIRRGGEISRAEISRLTDLNIVTVSNYVGKYVKSKLVFETGLDISSGGRRPELLKLNPGYCYSIGIDLGAPHLKIDPSAIAVLVDLNGKVVAKEKVMKQKESFEDMTNRIVDMVDRLVKNCGIPNPDIRGIGIGIWGVLDRYRGMVRYAIEEESLISYTGLIDQLKNKFYIPVVIEHDSTLAALGEKWSGVGEISAAENMLFVCSDSSCGIVIKNELYYGATKSAGELNINPPKGAKDPAAKCWETYDYGCCLRSRGIDLGIPSRLGAYLAEHPDQHSIVRDMVKGDLQAIEFTMCIEAAEKGDEAARKIIEEAGDYLGSKIAFLINLFNPEVVVVGRGVEKAGDLFFAAVRKAVRKWAYEESVKIVKILPASLGEDAVAVGAAALVTQDFFAKV